MLDGGGSARSGPKSRPGKTATGGARRPKPAAQGGVRQVTGPYVSCGPYEADDGGRYEVRLERVPGGVRLGAWAGGALERRAPVLDPADLPRLLATARERALLPPRDLERFEKALTRPPGAAAADARYGASPGRAGDMREELRVEALDDGRLRIARWILRPNQGWELQQAPTMLPAQRYGQAIADAIARGLIATPSSAPSASEA